jgi:hypothetical protein
MNLLPLQFVLFVLAQIFIFQHLTWSDFPPPHAFLTFLLVLPHGLQPWLLYLTGFGMGLLVDVAVQPLGAHAAASVILMGLRGIWIEIIRPRVGANDDEQVNIAQQSPRWLLFYMAPLLAIYTLVYMGLANLAFDGRILLKSLVGSTYSLVVCFLLLLVFIRTRTVRR